MAIEERDRIEDIKTALEYGYGGITDDAVTWLVAEVERLRAALVEATARANWGEDWAVTDGAGSWAELDTYGFGDGERVRHRARARAELVAEGLLPPE